MNPKYPVYIISKGRWESRLTSKALERMGVPYFIVVEKPEYEQYASVILNSKILVLPQCYKINYDTCDNLGLTKSTGPGAARNYCWEHSMQFGAKWHWVMDDNIYYFHRLNKNQKIICDTGTIFRCMEDFVERYTNVLIAGPNYSKFCKPTDEVPPFITNTRIYSCLLIKNDIPYRWRGRYNEDTDLSLRVLKDGFCTIQFNAFLADKSTTQRFGGGNTEEFYAQEGTLNKSEMIERLHPEFAKVVWKFHRWHHYVDYTPFKVNKLIKRENIVISEGVDNYGMRLIELPKMKSYNSPTPELNTNLSLL